MSNLLPGSSVYRCAAEEYAKGRLTYDQFMDFLATESQHLASGTTGTSAGRGVNSPGSPEAASPPLAPDVAELVTELRAYSCTCGEIYTSRRLVAPDCWPHQLPLGEAADALERLARERDEAREQRNEWTQALVSLYQRLGIGAPAHPDEVVKLLKGVLPHEARVEALEKALRDCLVPLAVLLLDHRQAAEEGGTRWLSPALALDIRKAHDGTIALLDAKEEREHDATRSNR